VSVDMKTDGGETGANQVRGPSDEQAFASGIEEGKKEFAKKLDDLLGERVMERVLVETARAVHQERREIVAVLCSRHWSGTEEIIAMIRDREAWRQPDMFPKESDDGNARR
jgi:hypothetical protein